jgi:pimeloyl-ACP methyl ester carboxylesterase
VSMNRLPGAEPRTIEIAGLSVEVFTRGEGRKLLYLHAGDGVAPDDPVIAELARSFHVIAPSHPGFGASELPREFATTDDLAYFYLDFLEALDLRNVVLVGSSFGGWVAAEIAIKSQERLSALVLAGALGVKFAGRETPEIADLFYQTHRDVRTLLYRDGRSDERDYALLSEDALTRIARNREALTLFGWSPLLHNPRLRQRLHRIKVPTLVLWGDSDRVVSPDYGRAFAAAIPGARFTLMANSGHYLHDELPAEFAGAVADFAGGTGA